MPDLLFFLERNSFFARADDQEAILRRCDHDANRGISFAEFCESMCEERQAAPYEARDDQKNDGQAIAEDGEGEAGDDQEAARDGEEENEFERVDNVEDDGQGPVEQQPTSPKNANQNSSAKRRSRQPPADNLTPAQRQ